MNYLPKNKSGNIGKILGATKHPNRLKIIFIALLFILLSAMIFLFPKATRNFFTTTATPVWKAGDLVAGGFQNVAGFFSFKSSLLAEVGSLQSQITTLELKQVDYDAVLKENRELKSLFGQTGNVGNRILARILSKPPQSPYDTFIIDTGSQNSVNIGNKVYISDTILIGTLGNIGTRTSIVNLFSKSGETSFLTNQRTGATYEVVGRGGANMSVEVPKDADILWGDVFTYPDIRTSIVGSVFYIDQSAQSSFKTILIRVPGNVFQTKWVMVEK